MLPPTPRCNSTSLIKSVEYATKTREWLKLPDVQQKWTAWKTTFREAYVAKRRAKAVREGEDKPFGGSAVNYTHKQMRRRGYTDSAVPDPLTNQMLNSIEGYLDNIAMATTKAVAKGGSLVEFSASLAI